MCVSPYIATKLTGEKVAVPCGKCIECRRQYQNEWTFRLSQEMKGIPVPVFVTLTYNDENLPTIVDPVDGVEKSCVIKTELQNFFKRLRKNGGEMMKDCKYFAIGEYGRKFNRAHYHAVIMSPNVTSVDAVRQLVTKCWDRGFNLVKFCTKKQIHYVCKYMNKLDERPHVQKPFKLYSKSLGLKFLTDKMVNYYLTTFDRLCINDKCKIGLPRYYRRKLDELSVKFNALAVKGLKYTDLVADVRHIEGTHYFYFKQFTDNFDDYYKLACREIATKSRKFGYQYYLPTDQEVFEMYRQTNEVLKQMLCESDRRIKECRIRNGLSQLQPVSKEFVNDKILLET